MASAKNAIFLQGGALKAPHPLGRVNPILIDMVNKLMTNNIRSTYNHHFGVIKDKSIKPYIGLISGDILTQSQPPFCNIRATCSRVSHTLKIYKSAMLNN